MGKLFYDSTEVALFDDRMLAHLQIAIGAKLRRKESFFLSWVSDVTTGSGRTTIWMDPHVPLRFVFSGNRMPSINRQWLELLIADANSAMGMSATSEPESST